jgi:CHASE3 domain sensor protein
MFGHLKLRGRILVGYIVPIPLTIVIAGMVYSNSNKVGQLIKSFNAAQEGLAVTDTLESDISAMERATRGYLLTKSGEHLKTFKESYKDWLEARQQIEKLLAGDKKEFFTAQQLKIYENLKQSGDRVKEIDDRLINLAQHGKTTEAIKLLATGTSTQAAREVTEANNAFNEIANKQLHDEEQAINSALSILNSIAVAGTLVSIVAAIVIGSWLASRISQNIKETIRVITSSSTEIAATTEQHERNAQQQAAAVNQTSTTMDELNASSRQAAEQAEGATAGARAIAEQVARLSEQTKQISIISNLVSDLANQTNMLALNAAVEAARAGGQGKGFAVVAEEIRKLADQSKKSGERINALIADIQAITESNIINTGDGARVESIVVAVNNIALNNQRISLTAKQQAVAIEQVVVAIESLSEGAIQTASGISQTKIGIQKLNEAAQNLEAVV